MHPEDDGEKVLRGGTSLEKALTKLVHQDVAAGQSTAGHHDVAGQSTAEEEDASMDVADEVEEVVLPSCYLNVDA